MSINRSIYITQPVGDNGGIRVGPDVRTVQVQLNAQMPNYMRKLTPNGVAGHDIIEAIYSFQKLVVGLKYPDGRVDPNGGTLKALNDPASEAKWAHSTKVVSAPSGGDSAIIGQQNTAIFPLPFRPEASYKTGRRYFGCPRNEGRRLHAGCDLIAPKGTPIYAVANGTVVGRSYVFVRNTDVGALEVDHGEYLVRYCEIIGVPHGLVKGSTVSQGQVIAHVGKMIRDSMLHFEMYSKEATGPLTDRSRRGYERRSDLINPTAFLDAAILRHC